MKNHNKKSRKKRKKNLIKKLCIIIPVIIGVGISLVTFYPKAKVTDDHTEVILLANMLKDENFSLERSKEILEKAYNNYFVSCTHDELIIGVYQTNGEILIIERIPFNN